MNTMITKLQSNHQDPLVRRVVDHMLEVYREHGFADLDICEPYAPLPDELSNHETITTVYKAFSELQRMGVVSPVEDGMYHVPGPNFPRAWTCVYCAMPQPTT